MLASWGEILEALALKKKDRQKVARLNGTRNGPIQIGEQGEQPLVDKAKLIEWWNHLAVTTETENRQRDARATARDKYDYSREGTVVPGISGSVKRRRKDRRL